MIGRPTASTPESMQEKHDGGQAGPLDVRVWLRMLSCTMTIEKQLRRRFTDQYDTTLPRFDVMASLDRHPRGQTMGQLSRALLVSNGNVTAIVRQLQEQGLVETRPDPDDRRSSIARLSEEGKSEFDKLAAAHHAWIGQAFAGLKPQSQGALYELLAEMKASIAAEGQK
jgi:DNA-binding MarR family transcriptional regulator